MKIAFIVSAFPKLSEKFIISQITGLLDLGHDVQIFAQNDTRTEIAPVEVEKYRLLERTHYPSTPPAGRLGRLLRSLSLITRIFLRRPIGALKALAVFWPQRRISSLRFFEWIKPFWDYNFDIIQCHFGPNGLRAVCLKQIGVPSKLVTTFHGYDVTKYIIENGTQVYDKLFGVCDRIIYNSNATKEKLLHLGGPEEKMVKVPMGVNPEEIIFTERTLTPGQPINFLSVGRLVEMKGREYAIKAVAKIIARFPDINYQIVGDGPLREPLQNLINHLKLRKNITLRGWVSSDELDALYKSTHLFIHPSVTAGDGNMEGQGVVLQEAQAAGIPLIATRHSAFPDSIIDGQSGFLVPERDADALAEKIEYLLEHPEIWPKMGRAGREFVEKNFDIKMLNQRLVETYQSLL